MMSLCSVTLFVVLVAPRQDTPNAITVISRELISMSPSFGSILEDLPDPMDPNKTIKRRVNFQISVSRVKERENRLDNEVWQTIRARPESPVPQFAMSTRFDAPADASYEGTVIGSAYELAVSKGADYDIGQYLINPLELAKIEMRKSDDRTVQIDPNLGALPGGWTVRQYGGNTFTHRCVITVDKLIEGLPTQTLKSWSVPIGTARVPQPDIGMSFVTDPTPTEPLDEPVGQTGGLYFEGGSPELAKFVKGVSLPYLTYAEIYAEKPLAISQQNYCNRILGKLGPTRLAGINAATGYTPKTLYDIVGNLGATGSSMNELEILGDPFPAGLENPCSGFWDYPPGTTWVPSEPGYQLMSSYSPIKFNFLLALQASTEGVPTTKLTMRTQCLNIKLKEPGPGVKYFPFAPSDPMIGSLSKMAEASRFKGPWDQARTWIYTDKVPLAEINKRLIPGISGGQYINGLHDVATMGGLTPKELARADMFDAGLLGNGYGRPAAVQWFLGHVTRTGEARMTAFFKSSPAKLLEMIQNTDKDIAGQGASIVAAGIGDDNPALRTAALEYAAKLSAADQAKLKPYAGAFRAGIYAGDAGQVDAILKMAESGAVILPADALGFLSVKGSTEEIKARAKALLPK